MLVKLRRTQNAPSSSHFPIFSKRLYCLGRQLTWPLTFWGKMASQGPDRGKRVHPQHPSLRIFLTPNGKSRNWYAGFYHSGAFIRESMRTSDYDAALAKAGDWYADRQYEIRKGTFVPPSAAKFAALIGPALISMAARGKSTQYIKGARAALSSTSYVRRFFGDMPVARITSRTWDDFRIWLAAEREAEGRPRHSSRTLHQMKNVVNLVLKEAYVQRLIDERPRFEDSYKDQARDSRPRTRFSDDEYNALIVACGALIEKHEVNKTRWIDGSKEMFDFVRFMRATGMRVGECLRLRFSDVRIVSDSAVFGGEEQKVDTCRVLVPGGKMGGHPEFTSEPQAVGVYGAIARRRGIGSPHVSGELIFLRHHRDMFRQLLKESGLHVDAFGRRRDFVSLRHTYICSKLEQGVPVFDVARNTRTSVGVIEKHYARTLPARGALLNQYAFRLSPQ